MGIRQCGKTFIAKHFADENYKNVVYMNFIKEPERIKAFVGPLDTQFDYNSRLLNLGKKKDTTPTKDRIEKMTEQEAKELLLKLLGTK